MLAFAAVELMLVVITRRRSTGTFDLVLEELEVQRGSFSRMRRAPQELSRRIDSS